MKVKTANGKPAPEVVEEVLPPNVKHRPFDEPVRNWYCDAKGCINAYVAELTRIGGEAEYKFCPYHWGVIVHKLVEVEWAPLEETLNR